MDEVRSVEQHKVVKRLLWNYNYFPLSIFGFLFPLCKVLLYIVGSTTRDHLNLYMYIFSIHTTIQVWKIWWDPLDWLAGNWNERTQKMCLHILSSESECRFIKWNHQYRFIRLLSQALQTRNVESSSSTNRPDTSYFGNYQKFNQRWWAMIQLESW